MNTKTVRLPSLPQMAQSRKARTLSAEDIAHYSKITVALRETIRLMSEIDEIIESHANFPLIESQQPQ